jgi:2-keto-myo-inositol isomerase
MKDIELYVAAGGSLRQLRTHLADAGIVAANAIAFAPWADADPEVRRRGFEQAQREMQMLETLGCGAVAAPPYGSVENTTLEEMAEYFASLVAIGRRM